MTGLFLFLLGLWPLGAAGQSPALAEETFIPRGARVVLLSGVPGDLEHETTYREQLQEWLAVARSAQPAGLWVLCDSPESLPAPAIDKVQVLNANREAFLTLARTQTNTGPGGALLVIAWGHGGRQGNKAVFHVRGPRLTPEDFGTLAGTAVASRWVLFFPGSGAFAHQLAGPGREILSSDCETMFHSDPIGMEVLLKHLRAAGSASFAGASEAAGTGIEKWYAERHLARTEEPTLWTGEEKPRRLARVEVAEDSLASVAPDAKTNAAPAATQTNQLSAENLPPAWEGIARVEREKYPGADAVILRQRLHYTLASDPALTGEQEQFIQVLSPEGKRFGDFDVSYSPPQEELDFQECEVLSPEGKLNRLDPDAIREAQDESPADYQTAKRKFFALPGVVPGAVLHVRYRTRWKKFPLPHVSLEVPLAQEIPAHESAVTVSVPKESPFHFAVEHCAAKDPEIRQTGYGTSYEWRFEDVPAHRHEALVPPGQRPRLLLSTFPDWTSFAEWYGRISKLADQGTPELEAKAKELTKNARDDREKVLALYNFVTSLRYVAVPMGVNSFRPHAAGNVLANQFGDCKDKANLLNALLRAVNIPAHLVLVPRFSQAHESIPGLAFNHAISRVTLGKEYLWLDTTDDVCRFGMLPPGDPGRNVLVIDGETSTLTQLPSPAPAEHQLTLRGQVDCSSSPDAVPVSLRVVTRGFPDYQLRATAREARDEAPSQPLLAANYRPVAGTFALEEQSASGISALDENFSWQAEGSCAGVCAGGKGQWLLHSPAWLPKEWELALHRRSAPLFLHQGYPLTLDEEFTVVLPARAQGVALPPPAEDRAEPLVWRVEWRQNQSTQLVARVRAQLVRGELSESDTPVFQRQVRRLRGALAAAVIFSAPENGGGQEARAPASETSK